jgi:hypothetical protein
MKKEHEKPRLDERAMLSAIAAQAAPSQPDDTSNNSAGGIN